jgi:hypothetical protein
MTPAASRRSSIDRARGLIRRRRRRLCTAPYAERLVDCAAPNAIWGADFKGHFPVADERGHPLTIMDGFSRYERRGEAVRRPLAAPVQKVFESRSANLDCRRPSVPTTARHGAGSGRLLAVSRVVDSSGHSSGADSARATGSERPP